MWVATLLGAWLLVGLLVAAFFAVLARGGSANTARSALDLSPRL